MSPLQTEENLLQLDIAERVPAAVVSKPRRRAGWLNIAVAAAFIIACTSITFLWMNRKRQWELVRHQLANALSDDAAPGGNRAILQLADGSRIILDSAARGILAHLDAADILKTDSGQLTYRPRDGAAGTPSYNSITTPRGGQFRITLPDGSQVWLNAASSLHFPTSFTGRNRTVELTGEAYFEVAHNPAMPFYVKTGDATVMAQGTNFNINAYANEPFVRATLLEGQGQVTIGANSCKLLTGQQAMFNGASSPSVLSNADTGVTMAWKNGLFHFEKDTIETVMRQVERWYDLDVVYKGPRPKAHYHGEMPRNVRASEMLKVLMAGSAHFRIEGKKIIVTQ